MLHNLCAALCTLIMQYRVCIYSERVRTSERVRHSPYHSSILLPVVAMLRSATIVHSKLELEFAHTTRDFSCGSNTKCTAKKRTPAYTNPLQHKQGAVRVRVNIART